MNKTLLAGAIALTMGVATNASAISLSVTSMAFGSVSAASGTADTNNLGTTFNGTFFGKAWTATTMTGYTATGAHTYAGSSPQGAFSYNFSLTAGQFAFGTLFDWSVNLGIPVLAIINADGTGVGTPMQVGPFPGQAPAFSGVVSAVPVPAAVWLFGSGLVGLAGVARRRKAA